MFQPFTTWFPLTAVLQGLIALLWAALASSYCRCHGTTRPQAGLLKLFRLLSWLFAAHYASKLIQDLGFAESSYLFLAACAVSEITIVALLIVMRHLVPLGILGEPKPGRLWLATNYGLGVFGLAALGLRTGQPVDGFDLFLTGVTALILWDLVRFARSGRRPILMADLRFGGYLALSLVLLTGVVILGLTERADTPNQSTLWIASHILVGLAAAAPFVLRIPGRVLSVVLRSGLRLVLGLGLFVALRDMTSPAQAGEVGPLDVLAALLLIGALGPGAGQLSKWVDRLVLRQDHRWRQQLLAAVRDLSPEAGIEQSCQLAASEVARSLRVPGAGILLEGSERPVTAGDIDLTPVVAVWPRGEDVRSLPAGAFDLLWLDDAALQEALYEARVSWVVSILSPRRHWGHLFVAAGLLGSAPSSTRLEALEDFACELALTLDAAELLARVRSAERELGRSEKLAALGESAARLAHEIRNPVTAARSLAQMMAAEPASPLNAEHSALVVRELDRVEERVRALLQFAKQEQFRFEPIDLSGLVRETVRDLESYPSTGDVRIDLQLDDGVMVAGDAERLRQVLVNLVSNGIDALARHAGRRELTISVTRAHGGTELQVIDSGPGVVGELLPRLFEPFVSTKVTGTGLGLAIARRIVDAHGGTIEASPGDGGGMVFKVRLPACDAGAELLPFPSSRRLEPAV